MMRAPAYPLITVDPYFSIWSMGNELNKETTRHWCGNEKPMEGFVQIGEKKYCFLGNPDDPSVLRLRQTKVEMDFYSTTYVLEGDGIRLTARFTSSLLPSNLDLLSRPVSYLSVRVESLDEISREVAVTLRVSDRICLQDVRFLHPTKPERVTLSDSLSCMRVGSLEQPVLGKSGDGICIDWGYFYLATDSRGKTDAVRCGDEWWLTAQTTLDTTDNPEGLYAFAYDDLYSLCYFGEPLQAYWKRNGQCIEDVISAALNEYDQVMEQCFQSSAVMEQDAIQAGGEKYRDLLVLAWRQVLAAHKLVLDKEGRILYVSKECHSGGFASTVDVSYPSSPLFLLYQPELLKGMLRPVFRFAQSDLWPFSFAPHDVGIYPILNGQVYSDCNAPDKQMPVEECGNMLILVAALSVLERDGSFAAEYREQLKEWADYLAEKGMYPENQLCTDDFAGFSKNNCNLSAKAILGLASYSLICCFWGINDEATYYLGLARKYAKEWMKKACNQDGSSRLSFDDDDTFSIKYNVIWDQIFGLELFPQAFYQSEFAGYWARLDPYGLPLDSRSDYVKSDWYLWCACFAENKEEFQQFLEPLWRCYDKTLARVPMTDWYSSVTSMPSGVFQHRSVQGGLWMRLLQKRGVCRMRIEKEKEVTILG